MKIRNCIICMCLLFLLACNSVPIAEDLDQQQANEITALLNSHGISSSVKRASGGKAEYSVEVKHGNRLQARVLLRDHSLPAEKKSNFSDLVAQRGLMPNSREIEQLKLDRALASEIEDALLKHSSITDVSAIVRMNYLLDGSDSGASIIIQERESASLDTLEVKRLVKRVLPGINDEKIEISISPEYSSYFLEETKGKMNKEGRVLDVALVPFLLWMVPDGQDFELALSLLLIIFIVGLVGVLTGYIFSNAKKNYKHLDKKLPDTGLAALKLDHNDRE